MEVSSGGRAAVTQSMTAGDVGEVIHGLADEPDVTVTISGSGPAAGKVMVAASGGNYFLGLLSPDGGVYQYAAAADGLASARTTFSVDGEVTEIRSGWSPMPGRSQSPSGNGWPPTTRRRSPATGCRCNTGQPG